MMKSYGKQKRLNLIQDHATTTTKAFELEKKPYIYHKLSLCIYYIDIKVLFKTCPAILDLFKFMARNFHKFHVT